MLALAAFPFKAILFLPPKTTTFNLSYFTVMFRNDERKELTAKEMSLKKKSSAKSMGELEKKNF